eukprot:5358687-Prymnesium_polylepis.1
MWRRLALARDVRQSSVRPWVRSCVFPSHLAAPPARLGWSCGVVPARIEVTSLLLQFVAILTPRWVGTLPSIRSSKHSLVEI